MKRYHLFQADARHLPLADKSVDLVFGSPPYEAARTYGIGFNLRGQDWVDFMVEVFRECSRVSRGLVAMVLQGQTRNYRWSATPALLMADLHRTGFCLRNPPIFHRVGIPGSGGPDWLRSDTEFIICATPSGKLPWSDNTACGHKPKFRSGGPISYRTLDGSRVNKVRQMNQTTSGSKNGDTAYRVNRSPMPDKANPGNVISLNVGGGSMGGDEYTSQNEAPFPEALAEFFIRSFCPPMGKVLDCFSGSGTTAAVAVRNSRIGIGTDIRESQVQLGLRRCESETPPFEQMVS